MDIEILNKTISFTKAAELSECLKSPAGSVFKAVSKANESKIRISVDKLVAEEILTAPVLRVPLHNQNYTILAASIPGPDPENQDDISIRVPKSEPETATIGGPEPRSPLPDEIPVPKRHSAGHFISIGGPEPGKGKTEPLCIELDATVGKWRIAPVDGSLDISLDVSSPPKEIVS